MRWLLVPILVLTACGDDAPPTRARTDYLAAETDYFAFDGPLDPTLEAGPLDASMSSTVLLLRIDEPADPHPIEVRFAEDGGPWGAPQLLSLLPLQGIPLAASARYAAVVTERVLDAEGEPIGRSSALEVLAAGDTPEGMSDRAASAHREALAALDSRGIGDVAALAVFDTQDPSAPLFAWRDTALDALPTLDATPERIESHDDFCVFESTLAMPIYQRGTPPFTEGGGGDVLFEGGVPVQQGSETARVLITLPRRPMPEGGFPLVVPMLPADPRAGRSAGGPGARWFLPYMTMRATPFSFGVA